VDCESFSFSQSILPKNLNIHGIQFAPLSPSRQILPALPVRGDRFILGGRAMTQGKNITSSFAQIGRAARSSSPLHFTPERAVAAISFHLIDEGIAQTVSEESVQRTLNRLRHEAFVLSVSARTWAVMTNAARLRRLLDETATEPALLPDDTVILAHRERKNR
jgi:hypothetical protein